MAVFTKLRVIRLIREKARSFFCFNAERDEK